LYYCIKLIKFILELLIWLKNRIIENTFSSMKKKRNMKSIEEQVIIEGSLNFAVRFFSLVVRFTFSSTDNKIMRLCTCLIGKYCCTWKVSFNARRTLTRKFHATLLFPGNKLEKLLWHVRHIREFSRFFKHRTDIWENIYEIFENMENCGIKLWSIFWPWQRRCHIRKNETRRDRVLANFI